MDKISFPQVIPGLLNNPRGSTGYADFFVDSCLVSVKHLNELSTFSHKMCLKPANVYTHVNNFRQFLFLCTGSHKLVGEALFHGFGKIIYQTYA